ncbi:MAG: hypothetical protein ACRD3G_22040 [Vicinamibacterales bacterium]
MARNLTEGLTAALLAFVAVTSVAAQPSIVTTEHTFFSYSAPVAACNGEVVEVTFEGDWVLHTTAFDDGRFHFAGAGHDDLSWTQSGVVYKARATSRFSQNLNNATFNDTFAVNAHGYGSDGSRVFITGVIHITVNARGDVSASFGNVSVDCQ